MAKRPMLNKAHDAATNKGTAITSKRVSISENPFEILKVTTLYYYIIIYYNITRFLAPKWIYMFSLSKNRTRS